MPPQASAYAGSVDQLFLALTSVSLLIVLLVFVPLFIFIIRYRRRSPDQVGQAPRGGRWLEIGWISAATFLSLPAFVWAATLYLQQDRPPADAQDVYVVARQWMWQFQHEAGQTEIDELHVPVGQPVKLTLTSRDVIHSLYVPALRVKADVLPGRYTTLWFTATEAGSYPLFCAEYCGLEHSHMGGQLVVMPPADYAGWLETQAGQSPAAAGLKLFQQHGCIQCHRTDSLQRAPNLVGVYGRPVQLRDGSTVTADENYLRQSILDPGSQVVAGFDPIMPSFKGQLSEDELLQLVAYIKSLAATGAGTGAAPPPAPVTVPAPTPSH